MLPEITRIPELNNTISTAIIFDDFKQLPPSLFNENEISYAKKRLEKVECCVVYKYPEILFLGKVEEKESDNLQLEAARKKGSKLYDLLKKEKIESVQLINLSNSDLMSAFLEGILLSCYSFSKYKKEKDDSVVEQIFVLDEKITTGQIDELLSVSQAVFYARDLVNEPLSFLTATQFSEEMEKMGKEAGFSVEVFNKKKIESLKMGGLLAVNKGSIDPPTFNILEWNPENAENGNPVVLVGKGVVYDTGGLSLKPTAKSMDYMKSDMAGAAAVVSAIYALAKTNSPVHVVGLIPATDNRPDGNAYAPGDIITMFDGTTVEIKNTDAEGRLILADALSYAKKYSPELVIDLATLTGAADIVAGTHGIVGMGNSKEHIQRLKETGDQTYERIIEVPLWEEYAKPLKSEIADLNNLGVREAQATIAGKFLEHFTSYNWIHLDTAGVSFLFEKDGYRPVGGTGHGVRLLFNFLKKFN